MDLALLLTLPLVGGASSMGCTGQLPNSFRLAQVEQTFASSQELNTKIDLLWIVDNSASMDVSQKKIREGFRTFSARYLQPTWDIHAAVITTDTYLAHPSFQDYLGSVIPGTVGWTSPTVSARIGTFQNPASNASLVNLSTGRFDQGVRYADLIPAWGSNYARLLPGMHDGPISGFCFEGLPYFLRGVSQCQIRDLNRDTSGPSACASPGPGQSSLNECVNTTQNDSVRTGKAILATQPAAGISADQAWRDQLLTDFLVNVTTGSAGHGSERGLSSVSQLLADNENSDTAFFRKDSVRVLLFVSDEDDQSFALPTGTPSPVSPRTGYACDQASLLASNPASGVTGNRGACCSDPAKGCAYGAEGTTCPSKTVDGFTYKLGICARSELLKPVSDFKAEFDTFFHALDASSESVDPNYFVVSIVPASATSIQTLQAARAQEDASVGTLTSFAVDRGDRYLELARQVGGGSMELDISTEDYSPVLDSIGRAIISKRSTFNLDRAPTSIEDMIVTVIYADGSTQVVDSGMVQISGKQLRITDLDFVLSLKSTDRISINYQPKTIY